MPLQDAVALPYDASTDIGRPASAPSQATTPVTDWVSPRRNAGLATDGETLQPVRGVGGGGGIGVGSGGGGRNGLRRWGRWTGVGVAGRGVAVGGRGVDVAVGGTGVGGSGVGAGGSGVAVGSGVDVGAGVAVDVAAGVAVDAAGAVCEMTVTTSAAATDGCGVGSGALNAAPTNVATGESGVTGTSTAWGAACVATGVRQDRCNGRCCWRSRRYGVTGRLRQSRGDDSARLCPSGGAGERMRLPRIFGVSMACAQAYSDAGATVASTMAGWAGDDGALLAGDGSSRPSERAVVMRWSPESASCGAVTSTSQGRLSSAAGSKITARTPRTICLPNGVSALQRGMTYNIHPSAAHPARVAALRHIEASEMRHRGRD